MGVLTWSVISYSVSTTGLDPKDFCQLRAMNILSNKKAAWYMCQ